MKKIMFSIAAGLLMTLALTAGSIIKTESCKANDCSCATHSCCSGSVCTCTK